LKLNRREACVLTGASFLSAISNASAAPGQSAYELVASTDRARILKAAQAYLPLDPVTVTSFHSDKSPAGPHDFFSQADYFWPNLKNPDGPYINRDGQSNPENFQDHRRAMIQLSIRMPALTAAWMLTRDKRYAARASDHLRAWFVTPATRMNPNLEFSQGVHGVSTGRSYGIIDTLHLVEVARAATILGSAALSPADAEAVKQWFRQYLSWMKNSEKGRAERDALNNHATCWALQASEFARLVGDETTRDEIRTWFVTKLLADQLGIDGSFPKELARTKPYSYSIFNFDVMTMLAQSLKGGHPDLTTFALPDGRGVCKAATFLYPYLKDKSSWPYARDVEHFDALPVRSPGLLFAGLACHRTDYLSLWKTMNPDPTDPEVIRNNPIRQPLLYIER
jgi:hypothetical protein